MKTLTKKSTCRETASKSFVPGYRKTAHLFEPPCAAAPGPSGAITSRGTSRSLVALLMSVAGTAALLMQPAFGQGVADPLRLQGLENTASMSARARAMGGASVAAGLDATSLFSNPATLGRVQSPQVFVGGAFHAASYRQDQQWIPNRLYAGLSLLFEDRLDGIKDSALQIPLDDIGPNWKKNTSAVRPAMAAAAMPLDLGGYRIVVGLGFRQAAQMDVYYQNNNALSPHLGNFRPEPILRPTPGDSLNVRWYQFSRQREGAVYGITPAVAIETGGGLTLAASATILTGSTDDSETRLDRGFLTLLTSGSGSFNVFRLFPPMPGVRKMTGTSKFKGVLPTAGALYHQESFSIGVSMALPATITRTYTFTYELSPLSSAAFTTRSGKDNLKLPVSYSIGLALHPSQSVDVAVDYDVRRYGKATLSGSETMSVPFFDYSTLPVVTSSTTNPWLGSNLFHFGVEYRPAGWLALRGGYREDVQVFAPAGDALIDEPVRGSAYSAGIGLRFGGLMVDAAYEMAHVSYQDSWVSNINTNTRDMHTVLLQLGMSF